MTANQIAAVIAQEEREPMKRKASKHFYQATTRVHGEFVGVPMEDISEARKLTRQFGGNHVVVLSRGKHPLSGGAALKRVATVRL